MDFGILVDKLDNSQKSTELTLAINEIHNLDLYGDVIIFTPNYGRPLVPSLFCILNDYEAVWYNGPLISTCLKTTRKLQKCNTSKKYYYMYDLEWIYQKSSMSKLRQLLDSEDIQLIARSLDHYNIIKRIFKEPIGVVSKDFGYEEFKCILEKNG